MQLQIESETMGAGRAWGSLLAGEGQIIERLRAVGFRCDLKERQIYLPLIFDRELFACAFEQELFDEALEPINIAINLIVESRPLLDQLLQKLRSQVS